MKQRKFQKKTAENEETTEETVESVDQGELELTGQSDLTNSVEGVEGVENGEGSISTSSSDNKDSSSNIDSDAKSNGDNVNSETSGDANSDSSPEHNSESGSSSAVTGNIIKSFFKQIYNLFFPLTGKNIQEEVIKGEITLIEPFIYNLSDGESAKIISSSEDVYLSVTDKQAVVTTSYIGADELTVDINLSDLNIPANEGELIISLVYDGVELTSNSKKIKLDKILLNETALNNTLLNDSLMNITVGNITITTLQFDAVLGQSVKWKKKISLNESMPINITLPKQAENITVYKIVEDLGEEIAKEKSLEERVLEEISGKFDESEENLGKIEDVREEITEDNYNLKENIPDNYSGSFTGFVIEIQEDLNTEDAKEIVIDAQNATEFEIEYETPAPVAVEQKTADGKEITISSNIHYENILAYTELPKETQVSSIRLYNIQNESKVPVEFLAKDTNNNSLADIVYWIVPSLSNQTYLLVIEISKAEHLDENRNYLENIYEQVKLIDGNWSPVINSNEYIRVTFEQELDSTRDITLYPRIVNGSPSIEVYEFNKTEVIAKFESLTDNQYNKVYLINLSGQQDTFDLRITNGSIEVDYIVDPYGGPNLSYVILNATDIFNRTDKNLTVYTDQDSNSSLKLIRNWNKNGNPMTILNMPFEGGSNATFTKDYSNYSNNGTVTGATWNSSGGYDGKGAYKFDGTNDIINASPNAADLIERPEYTVSLWFNAAGAMGSLDGIISKSSSSPFLWGFRRASATTVLEWYTNGSSNVLQSTLTPTANTWYHVALVFDNTVGKKIYINGVLNVNNTDKTRTLDNSDSLLIGTDYRNDNTRNFWGLIDDIIIFNESLSSEQINALYNNRTDLIVAQETEVGDIWQACITPNDGIADGAENCSNPLTIRANSPPTHSQPILNATDNPLNRTTANLTVYNQSTSDFEGDSIKNIINWNKNGNPMTILNMPFEGGSNATFTKDYSNYSNNGTVTGATWNSSGGYDGKGAYKFDGTNDIINASPNAADLIERPEYTVSLWFNAAGAMGSLDGIISKSSSSPFLWGFRRASATTVLEWYTNGSSNVLQSTLTPTANTWYHVALVFDNTVGKKIYINGVLNVNNTDKTRTLDNSDSLLIGTDYRNDNTRNFWGLIDDIIIFNESLSSEQINALYNNRTDLIVAQETEVGDIWQACITPNDGIADGAENCSNPLTIRANSPPTHSQPILNATDNPLNRTTANLTVYNQSTSDFEGDSIKNIINWNKN